MPANGVSGRGGAGKPIVIARLPMSDSLLRAALGAGARILGVRGDLGASLHRGHERVSKWRATSVPVFVRFRTATPRAASASVGTANTWSARSSRGGSI